MEDKDRENSFLSEIAERVRSEQALKESEEMALALMRSAMDAIIIIDNEGKIVFWNPSAEKIFGYRSGEALGKEVHSFIAPASYQEAYRAGFANFRETGRGPAVGNMFEFSALKKNGTEFPIELSLTGFRIGGLWHAAAIIRDVSERREMEQSLYREKRLAESLVENTAVATFVLDPLHRVVFWNRACEELTGVPSADMIGTKNHWRPFYPSRRQTLADIVIDGNYESIPELYEKHAKSALVGHGFQAEGWYADLNGKRRYIVFDASPIVNDRGELIFAIETLQDMTDRKEADEELDRYRTSLEELVRERTAELRELNDQLENDIYERKQAEEALRLSESRFEEAQRVARIGTWEWNLREDTVYWSDEVFRIFGLEPRSLFPQRNTFLNYIHTEDREMVKLAVARALYGNSPYDIESRMTRVDGSSGIIHAQGKVYFDPDGRPVMMLGNVQDITARKRMEEELLKIQKLESIGILAGGIAHDFNNLLSAIMGNISLARLYSKPGDKIHDRLKEAENACCRATELARQLLTFSKGGEPLKKISSISRLVRDAADFALRGSNIEADFFFAEDLWPVHADEAQIIQVINNIVINSKHAMPHGGAIEVEGRNLDSDGKSGLPLKAGIYVVISVTDQGTGIPQENIEKIFDPYFTTKAGGSGLGLATSYSIIKKHGGHITARSRPGAGSTFSIYIPAAEGEPVPPVDRKEAVIGGKGRILVMDDEDIIRFVAGKMLSELGYDAEYAENGEEALALYLKALKEGRPFDAVLIDLTIRGGMGGVECVKELFGIDPMIKAIVSSGYSDDPTMSRYREFGFAGIITKPYRIEDLSDVLYSVLRGPSKKS